MDLTKHFLSPVSLLCFVSRGHWRDIADETGLLVQFLLWFFLLLLHQFMCGTSSSVLWTVSSYNGPLANYTASYNYLSILMSTFNTDILHPRPLTTVLILSVCLPTILTHPQSKWLFSFSLETVGQLWPQKPRKLISHLVGCNSQPGADLLLHICSFLGALL